MEKERNNINTKMELWFSYAMNLAELVYDMKLHEYEEVCAMALAVEVDHQLIARHITSVEGQQLVEVKVATNFLDRMQLRKPIRAMKTHDFIDAIECEKEYAYYGLEAGYRLLPEDLEAVQACAEQNGWASRCTTPLPSNRSSVGEDGAAAPGQEDGSDGGRAAAAARERAALLYGEMTSVGTRQLYHYFRDAIESALPARATRGVVQVGMDVGCGTGKVLYEWARLAAAESTCAPVATATLDKKRKKYNNFVPYLSMARSPQSLMSSCASSYNLGHSAKMPTALQQLMQQDESFPTVPHPSMDLPRLRGWLGVGIEVAPTRMYVARQALAPYYLDLQRQEMLLIAGRRSGTGLRFDPAPPRAVACPHQDPSKRQPTACVLLHEGDMLTPGLLSNSTLRRFPAVRLSGDTPTTPTSAKDNYYRIARTENGAVLTGVEEIHLSVFCCGLALDETVVRLLCQQMEGLLHRAEPRGSDSDEEEEEPIASSSAGANHVHRRHQEHPSLHQHESQPSTFTFLQHNPSPTCFSQSLTGGRTTAVQPAPVASRHWRSVTFVLLLSPDFEERQQLQDLPLFRCCRRVDLEHDASFQQQLPSSSTQQQQQQPPPRDRGSPGANVLAAAEDGGNPLVGVRSAQQQLSTDTDLLATDGSAASLGSVDRTPARYRHQHTISGGSTGLPPLPMAVDKELHHLRENENSKRWLDNAELRTTPAWLKTVGLEDSTLQKIHLSTTWMDEAPAYLLHFRFEVREEELDASMASQAPI